MMKKTNVTWCFSLRIFSRRSIRLVELDTKHTRLATCCWSRKLRIRPLPSVTDTRVQLQELFLLHSRVLRKEHCLSEVLMSCTPPHEPDHRSTRCVWNGRLLSYSGEHQSPSRYRHTVDAFTMVREVRLRAACRWPTGLHKWQSGHWLVAPLTQKSTSYGLSCRRVPINGGWVLNFLELEFTLAEHAHCQVCGNNIHSTA
jgi:hypothetical protein